MRSYTLVVPSKSTPDSRPKWAKCIPVFRPKRCKNPTQWGATCLYSLYKGVPPSPGGKHFYVRKVYCTITNEIAFLLTRIITLKKRKLPICSNYCQLFLRWIPWAVCVRLRDMSVLQRVMDIKGVKKGRDQLWVSVLQRCPSYTESNKGNKERQGPTLSVRFTEMSVLQRCPLKESEQTVAFFHTKSSNFPNSA